MRPTNLPESIINEIPRESLVDGILFQTNEHPVVIVSGPANIGKTTLLAQFYAAHTVKKVLRLNIAALTDKKLQGLVSAPQIQITLEIDLHPPEDVITERRKTKHGVDLDVFTLPSLMSGKLHILLTRRDREKGRDWYDYAWYRQQGILPNLSQLQSAIDQTNGGVSAERWPTVIREIIAAKNWAQLRDDVRPFLERRSDLDDLTEAKILALTPDSVEGQR